jgi:hypothetical protein
MFDAEEDPICAASLFSYTGLRRESAHAIQRKARHVPLLVDELHEAKAKVTGNGWAYRLTNIAATHWD